MRCPPNKSTKNLESGPAWKAMHLSGLLHRAAWYRRTQLQFATKLDQDTKCLQQSM
jgi:hypothetical protein